MKAPAIVWLIVANLAASFSVVTAWSLARGGEMTATGAQVPAGERLYLAMDCYACHGTTGTGASTGPTLAPNPISLPALSFQLRHPRGSPPYGNIKMPAYGPKVLSDAQITLIYDYLASIRPGPKAADIPLLNQ